MLLRDNTKFSAFSVVLAFRLMFQTSHSRALLEKLATRVTCA